MEKKKNRYNWTAAIDADYVLWIACHGNKILDGNGSPLREDGRFVYEDKTLEQAINTCDSYLNDVLHTTQADSYIMCLSPPVSFRQTLDSSYKSNRAGMSKPLWYEEVKQHMRDHWGAIEVPDLEADDVVVLIHKYLENAFIIAVDKDILDCVPGRHYDGRKGRSCFITTTESQADFNFAVSLLVGDAIDGIPHMKKGYGPMTAKKQLLASTQDTLELAALEIYINEFGLEVGTERFNRQRSLLKMVDSLDDLPEGVIFEIPEPDCYNCVSTEFSGEEYWLEFGEN